MGYITRCPLNGEQCAKQITLEEKTFFLAEAEKPDYDKNHREEALKEATGDEYIIRSALEEKGINAFTCKICEMIQTCAYGIVDISQNNANVFMELGIMLALGKPTIILVKKGQGQELRLPSNLDGIEVIPFSEYLEIIAPFRKCMKKLPSIAAVSSPVENLEKIDSKIVEKIERVREEIIEEFKKTVEKVGLDKSSSKEERKELSPELNERLSNLDSKLESLKSLGIVKDAQTHFLEGDYLNTQKKHKEAITSYTKAIDLKPDYAEAFCHRGISYRALEKYPEAVADFGKAIELKPDYAEAYYNRGDPLRWLNEWDKAIADFKKAVELNPKLIGSYYIIACYYSLQNKDKVEDALKYLEIAISKDKKFKEMAKTEPDFNNIRDDPRFNKLIE